MFSVFAVCPEWFKSARNDFPVCPPSGMVPETFPIGAVVVSDTGGQGQDASYTADVVEKVLMNAGPNLPLMILPVSDKTMTVIRQRIDSLNISEQLKKQYKASLMHVPTSGYTWQQDYMQSVVNPATGQPMLREIVDYERQGNSFNKIIAQIQKCGIIAGPPLKAVDPEAPYSQFENGNMGGNIEALPGNICLLGSDHLEPDAWVKYANQICSTDPEERIKVPTSWLDVGHTDEVMKVVRNKKAQAPCDFSIAVASPDKALELLKANPENKFIDFQPNPNEPIEKMTSRRVEEYSGLSIVCRKKEQLRRADEDSYTPEATGGVSSLFDFANLLINTAYAGISRFNNCTNMKNSDAYRVFTENVGLKNYNKLIQDKMNSLKIELQVKLKKKFPACEIDIFDTPDLFFGGTPVESSPGNFELPNRQGNSVFPNPTNAISINDTVVSPEPSNASFRKYIQEQYAQRGLNAEFVDTFDYAHQKGGNLHCSTNTIHMCKSGAPK